MFEALFGTELPLGLRFFIAFLFVLGLIGGAAYLVRRFGAGALSSAGARGRQPRLAVVDSAPIDGRRRLVIVRRDNVEHLVMIGGPSDVVVETNIVRSAPATAAREPAPMRVAPEPVMRHAAPSENNMWPLQPEPLGQPPRPPMEEPAWQAAMAEPMMRGGNGDRLAGLASELARVAPASPAASPVGNRANADFTPGRSPDYVAVRPTAEPRRAPAVAAPPPVPVPPPTPAPAPVPAAPVPTAADEQNLAEMAHRLEAALRRPTPSPGEAALIKQVIEPTARPMPAEPAHAPAPRPAVEPPRSATELKFAPPEFKPDMKAPEPQAADPRVGEPAAMEHRVAEHRVAEHRTAEPRVAEPRPAEHKAAEHRVAEHRVAEPKVAEPKPQPPKSVYDSLEQEMASLLGRPSGKP
jgi:hypothetical protein